ncbi:MAG TPA: hypothetical protein VNS32_21855, partial [Flavisolibacter sp.]|nr:hypothetical protein [Flavisolibacter sp.]
MKIELQIIAVQYRGKKNKESRNSDEPFPVEKYFPFFLTRYIEKDHAACNQNGDHTLGSYSSGKKGCTPDHLHESSSL